MIPFHGFPGFPYDYRYHRMILSHTPTSHPPVLLYPLTLSRYRPGQAYSRCQLAEYYLTSHTTCDTISSGPAWPGVWPTAGVQHYTTHQYMINGVHYWLLTGSIWGSHWPVTDFTLHWLPANQRNSTVLIQIRFHLSMTSLWQMIGLLGFNASATARVISRRWNDDDEISFLVEETGVPGGNHRSTASNWWNFSHIRPSMTNDLFFHLSLFTMKRLEITLITTPNGEGFQYPIHSF